MQFFKNKYFFEEYPTPSLLFELNSLEIKAVNNAALSLYGYNREEMLLLTIKDLRPEEEVPKLIRFLNKNLDCNNGVGVWKHKTKDERIIFVNILCSRLQIDKREYVLVTVNDVTHLKKVASEYSTILTHSLHYQKLLQTIIDEVNSVIYIKDKEGKFRFANQKLLNLFNLETEKEIIGRTDFNFLSEEIARQIHLHEEKARTTGEPVHVEERLLIKEDLRTYSGTKIPLKGHERYENCVLGISEDITKRLAIEEHLKTYIKESEVLLSEIHHRVKNNLAVISGLMEIQVLKSDSKETRDKIKDCQARINSIALTHELVYREKKFSEINFGELIKKIAKNVVSTFDQNVTLDFNIEPVILNINQALPSSLFVNEIVTNAMKHAFETAEDPIIEIEMYETDKNVILSISDNGCGFPENFKFAQEKSLGLKLIKIAKDQLNAELKVNSINGVLFELIFKKLTIKGVGSSIDIPLKTGPD